MSMAGARRPKTSAAGWCRAPISRVLGANPVAGRVFTADSDRADTTEAVVSHSFWQRRFGGRPDVIGRTLTIRNATLSIVGVMPAGFVGETSGQLPDLWVPLRLQPRVLPGNNYLHDAPPDKAMWLHLFGRLKPGVSFAEAEARANGVLQANLIAFYGAAATGERRAEFLESTPADHRGIRGASYKRAELSGSLTALMVGVGILLLIACANLANLLLARGAARRAELTLRLSLGAGRGRLMRQLVTESLVLAAAGGVAAAAVAAAMHRGLVVMLAEADPAFALSFSFDAPIAVFLVGCTFTAALLFGLLPAWQATATDASSALKEQGRGAIGTRMRGRSGRVLVGVQLALSLPLLVGAGLLARTAYNVQRIDLGVNVDNLDLLLARVDLRATIDDPARRDAMRQALLERIRQAPGVRSATFSQLGLFSASFSTRNIQVEGYTPQAGRDPETNVDAIGSDYFATLGMRLIQGRDIQDSDTLAAPKVCVVNESFANRYFARRNPIGLRVMVIDSDEQRTPLLVVGVARDARTRSPRGAVEPRIFVSSQQQVPGVASPHLPRARAVRRPDCRGCAAGDHGGRRERAAHVDPHRPRAPRAADGAGPGHCPPRARVRRCRPHACRHRSVWRPVLWRRPAHERDRRPHCSRRASFSRHRDDCPGDRRRGRCRRPRRWRSRLCRIALHRRQPVRRRAAGSRATFTVAAAVLLVVAGVAAYLPARRASKLEPVAALRSE